MLLLRLDSAELNRRDHAGYYVVNPSVVPRRGSVSEHRDRATLSHQRAELPDGEVRSLARPVDRKEAKADDASPVNLLVYAAQQLRRPLRSRVGGDRLDRGIVLCEGYARGVSVHRG